jgi:NAD(P)-dependent dehydrogenase (short-subunit alcohol dehydrogenase family)
VLAHVVRRNLDQAQAGQCAGDVGLGIVRRHLAAHAQGRGFAAALSKFSKKGLTDIEDIAPIVRFLVTEGWWITGQTIFANGGYTTR